MPSIPLFRSVLLRADTAAKSSAVTSIPLPSAPVTVFPSTLTFAVEPAVPSTSQTAIPENPGFVSTFRWITIPAELPPTKIVEPKSSASTLSFV